MWNILALLVAVANIVGYFYGQGYWWQMFLAGANIAWALTDWANKPNKRH